MLGLMHKQLIMLCDARLVMSYPMTNSPFTISVKEDKEFKQFWHIHNSNPLTELDTL